MDTENLTEGSFDWGNLGEPWWVETGGKCSATEKQIKFACARHAGASATGAARLAGYSDSETDASAIRQAGHKAVRSTAVLNMLALADAEDEPTAGRVLDKQARAQMLSELAEKNPDPTIKLRALEAMNRMSERETELGQALDQDGFSEWRLCREYLQMAGGPAAFVHLWNGMERGLSNLPLLHDVHRAVMRDDPELWDRSVKRSAVVGRAWLERNLADPSYQLEARVTLWREVGIEIEIPPELRPAVRVSRDISGSVVATSAELD